MTKMLLSDFPDKSATQAIKEMQKTMPLPWRDKEALTVQEVIAWVQIRRALQPLADTGRRDLLDRVEGKPTIKVAGPDGGPLTLDVDYSRLTVEELRELRVLLEKAGMTTKEERAIEIAKANGADE